MPGESADASGPPIPGRLAGRAVRAVLRQLAARGVSLAVDGIFGPQTDAAVRAYQQRLGLAVDGIVGPQTWHALLAGR